MKKSSKKGFTIVELVIVIAVIAILAAVLIPTYSSLVKKANLSADEQAVKQMNTALKIYEAENGKPESIAQVKTALYANDINIENIMPVTQGYAFYWDPTKNEIVLVGADKAVAESEWLLLKSSGYGVEPTERVKNFTTLQKAVNESSTDKPVLVTLNDDLTIAEAIDNCQYISIKTGQSVILDLNGHTITNAKTDDNVTPVIDLKKGATVVVKNGTLKGKIGVTANSGSSVSLSNVTFDCSGSAIFAGGLTDVSVVNCTIKTTGSYGITSNSGDQANDGTRFYIYNTTIESKHAGIYIGTYAEVVIEDCEEIKGEYFGAFFRGCNVTIKNSTIFNTNTNADIDKDAWSSGGPNGPAADIVFACGGTNASGFSGYAAVGNYICENVTIGQNGENPQVFVHQPEGGKVTVSGVETITHTCHKTNDSCDRTHTD